MMVEGNPLWRGPACRQCLWGGAVEHLPEFL